MTKRIDFLMPFESAHGALYCMMEKISEAFIRKGYRSRIIHKKEFFTLPVDDPPDMTFSFNNPPLNENYQFLCDINKTIHFSYLVDPPYRFTKIFSSPFVNVGCDDRYYCEFLKDIDFKNTCFFPHGVDRNLCPDSDIERDIDVLMLASYTDYERMRKDWYEVLPEVISFILDDAIEITLSDNSTSFMKAFVDAYQNRLQLKKKPKKLFQDFSLALVLLERYIKGKERVDLVKSIKDANVHIFGGPTLGKVGWEKVVRDTHPNITIHEPVNYNDGLELMKRSKIVLNAFSKNKEGAHERIFNGMACGALTLTNENIYLRESFTDEKNILFYRPYQLEDVNEIINKYLNEKELRQSVAEAGRKETITRHTWDHRIDALSGVWKHLLGE
jgi:spore maturation protein CgeB